jgi:glycosyltransferase involved in cell wall biosynthesis
VSDLEIFHEVAGDGAAYFSATSPDEFAQQVESLSTPEARQATSTAGLEHISRFTWAASAQRLLELARDLAG